MNQIHLIQSFSAYNQYVESTIKITVFNTTFQLLLVIHDNGQDVTYHLIV